jgi:FkbM family methyltransferase
VTAAAVPLAVGRRGDNPQGRMMLALPKFRGSARVYALLSRVIRPRAKLTLADLELDMDLSYPTHVSLLAHGVETEVLRLASLVLEPGFTAFDIGANAGVVSLWLAHCVGPTGRVVSVEANPSTFAHLDRWITAMGATTVMPIHRAISDVDGQGVAIVNPRSFFGMDTGGFIQPGHARIDARTIRIDTLVQRFGMPQLIKIDVEGAELLAARGGRETFASPDAPAVILETGTYVRRFDAEPIELLEHFEGAGYPVVYLVSDDGTRITRQPFSATSAAPLIGRNLLLVKSPERYPELERAARGLSR